MRRLRAVLLAATLAVGELTISGCRREEKIKLEATDESTPVILSTASASDPNSSIQLIKGFHNLEQNAWRWTMGSFAVTLRPPQGSAERGAVLMLKFTLPEPVMQKSNSPVLSATVQNVPVGTQIYKSAGEYTFTADVPGNLLKPDIVTAEFSLDPFLAAGTVDARELGLVYLSSGLQPK